MRNTPLRLGLLATALAFQPLAFVRAQAPNQSEPATITPSSSKDALTIYSAGLEGILVDPKDKGLATALRLLDERLLELPNETGNRQMPAAALQLGLELFLSPMSFRAGVDPNANPNQGPPLYGQFNFFTPNAASAEALAGRFSGTVAGLAPMPSKPAPNVPGMQMIDLQGTPLYHGAIKAGGESAFSIAINKVHTTPLKLGRMDLPEGVSPALAFVLDGPQLQPLIEMGMAQAGPDAEDGKRHMEMMGLYGPDAATFSVALGYSADRGHFAVRYGNYRKVMEKFSAVPSERLTAEDFRRIPADATYAQISKYNPASIGQMLKMLAADFNQGDGEALDPLAMIEQQTGVHPQRDIFDHLGQTVAVYMSDTTGGGGLLSMAGLMAVKNPEALGQTMNRVNAMLNQMAQQHAKGYVRIATRTINDQPLTILTFPGLPVPLELCWSMADGYLYFAGSPQALTAAMNHSRGGKNGLMDNPRFKELNLDLQDAIQISFIDTPRLIRDGYGIVNLAMSALANAVRSPTDPARDAGIIMPSYSELSNGARVSMSVMRIQGNDFVLTGTFDRSLLVNACGSIGVLGGPTGAIITTSLGAGILLPALGKARENAKALKSAAQLRQISMAAMTYSQEFNDAMPPSLQTLIDHDYMTEELLDSPVGPAPDGADYWIDFSVKKLSDVAQPNRRIMGYDRAMYANTDDVAVLFFDGHVETMSVDDFAERIMDEMHVDVDFDLP